MKRKFTLLLTTLLMLGAGSSWAESMKLYCKGLTQVGSSNASYADGNMSWKATSNAGLIAFTFSNGELAKFSKLYFTFGQATQSESNISNATVKLVFHDGSNNVLETTYYTLNQSKTVDLSTVTLSNSKTLADVKSIRFYGGKNDGTDPSESAPFVMPFSLNSIYLETASSYAISSADDWSALSTMSAAGIVKGDVSMTTDVNAGDKVIGTSSTPFSGSFDGGSNSLTFTYSGTGNYIAPFAYVKDATIQNLNTKGSIESSSNLLAGIVGNVKGTTSVNNCASSMSIRSTDSSNGRIGGIVARCADSGASLTVSNCLFNGSLNSAKSGYANGVVGWANGTTVNLSSCFVNPTSVTNGGERFCPVKTTQTNLWFTGSSFTSNTGGTEATEAKLISGEVAYDLQNSQTTQYWGQAKLNTSIAVTVPELTSDDAKKVIKLTMSNSSAPEYANKNGAMPSPVDKGALSFWNGTSGDPYTSLSGDATVSRNFAKYSLTVTSAGATTLVLPVAVSTLPTGVKAYKLTYTSGDKEVTATEVNSITANMPVLINANEGTYVFESSNSEEITYDTENAKQNGALYGVYTDTYKYVPADSYVLQNGSEGLGFYKVAAENTIKITSFRAYLTAQSVPTTPAPALLSINFEDENATAISSVERNNKEDDAIYTLTGIKVEQPTSGIYIKNGKKYYVK